MPANVCDRCGYAHGVKRILVMVDGRAVLERKLCAEHLDSAIDALQARVKV